MSRNERCQYSITHTVKGRDSHTKSALSNEEQRTISIQITSIEFLELTIAEPDPPYG